MHALSAPRRWTVVLLLCLAFMIAYVDRVNFSVVLAHEPFKAYFHLGDRSRGVLLSAFFWAYAFLQLPAGWIIDRWGSKRPYAIGFFLWSVVSATTAWTTTLWQLAALRALLGVGESIVTPAGISWIRLHFGESRRGFVMGIYNAASKLGPAVGTWLATELLLGVGWRGMFLILGLGSLVWLIPWCAVVPGDLPRTPPGRQPPVADGGGPGFSAVLRSPAIWGVLMGTFAYNYLVHFSLTWLPSIMVERLDLSLKDMERYVSMGFTGLALVAIGGGWLSDRLIAAGGDPMRVRRFFVVAGLLLGATEAVAATSRSPGPAVFFTVFSLSGLGLMTGSYWALTQSLVPGAMAGRTAGLQNLASNLSGIVAPLLTGWLKSRTGGYEASMVTTGLVLLSGMVGYLVLVHLRFAPAHPAGPLLEDPKSEIART
jgi:MFS family permease